MATIADNVTQAIQRLGRTTDTAVVTIMTNQFVPDFYKELNQARRNNSGLECCRTEQQVAITAVHTGLIQLPTNHRHTKRIILYDANNNRHDTEQCDWFIAHRRHPLGTEKGTPCLWDLKRAKTAAQLYKTVDEIEIFPKPDKNYNLVHTYYAWLVVPTGTASDVVLDQWENLLREYLLWQGFSYYEEDIAAQKHRGEFARLKDEFTRWDESLSYLEDQRLQEEDRAGFYNEPLLE
jgi:hypothetical protein